MKQTIFLFLIFLMLSDVNSQDISLLTHYEKSACTETPRYPETIEYCMKLAAASPMITYSTFGKSAQERDLPLLILDKDGFSDPSSIHAAGRVVLLIQACIHPGESEGKDAGLMLLRDIVMTNQAKPLQREFSEILSHVSILFIPVFNVDGHERFGPFNRINQNGPKEMGWRVTANNLNLNRDFLKADAPEMKAWLTMFNAWMPDFFIDIHTTDGADYQYVLTYLMETSGEMDNGLTSWSKDNFLPSLKDSLERGGFQVFPYVDFRSWHDPRSGLITEVAPPMLSQGYSALRNRPGLLIETHMLKPYKQRVESTYACLAASLKIVNREYRSLKTLIALADQFVCSNAFLNTPFPLQFETSENDSIMVDFKGMKYEGVKSEISGGIWFQYSKDTITYRLPYFSKNQPVITIKLPYAYIIPVEWREVIERLKIHGIRMKHLSHPITLPIHTYKFKNPKWQQNSYEGRHFMTNIEYDIITETRLFPAGSVVVEVNQQAGRIIPHILEPEGNGSYLYWGFFDAIMEQKEYAESYVLEKMAVQMLADNPVLKTEFESKKNSDTTFARNPQMILNWFYARSPFIDGRKGIYPVGRIEDLSSFMAIMKE